MSSIGKPSEVPAELAAVLLQHLEAAERELHGAGEDTSPGAMP